MTKSRFTQYKWPDGEFHCKPYIRIERVGGVLALLKRIRFAFNLYKRITVIKEYRGDEIFKVAAQLNLPKKLKTN
jgi:cbb3-type cytochrome oxidase subunit 1